MLCASIHSWIIQDGNYGDFRVGEQAKFALEFYPQTLKASKFREASVECIQASRYRIRGQVIYVGRSVWVIDFGVMAYQNHEPPTTTRKGDWIEGEVDLGIDPFFYFEELHLLPGMPALQYEWRIKAIFLETTPWLSRKDEFGRTIRLRDEQHQSFVEVAETNAWSDNEGDGQYVLECDRIG